LEVEEVVEFLLSSPNFTLFSLWSRFCVTCPSLSQLALGKATAGDAPTCPSDEEELLMFPDVEVF
jgi:hypothetical protein